MVDVVITYETLFDLLRKEKSQAELQELPEDFYGQVVAYLRQKEADVKAAGGPAKAQKALIQERNAKKILRELHERRERKIIEMAINRARSESNIIDTNPLLREEQGFYAQCAELFLSYKRRLLATVLEGGLPEGTTLPAAQETPVVPDTATPSPASDSVHAVDVSQQEACTVRFLSAVPRFLGLHGEVHGPFEPGQTAVLPGKIAALLLKKRRAELTSELSTS